MTIFGFTWLNSKERAELKRFKEEAAGETGRLTLATETATGSDIERDYQREEQTPEKPFKNIYFQNNVVTVVFRNGIVITKEGATPQFIRELAESKTEEQVYAALSFLGYNKTTASEDMKQREENLLVKDNYSVLKDHPDFLVREDAVYLKNVGLAIPAVVVSAFIQAVEKGNDETFGALKMFWLWTSLNPIESSRNDLLNFVRVNDIKITKNGLLQCYRRVVTKGDSNKVFTSFISNQYTKLKKWKKSPKNYYVIGEDDGSYTLSQNDKTDGICKVEGNLEELYLNLPNLVENIYTDNHTRSKKIKIGQVYQEDEDKIDLNNGRDCSSGLICSSAA